MEEKIPVFCKLYFLCFSHQHPPPNVAPLIIQLQHHQSCQGTRTDLQATDNKTSIVIHNKKEKICQKNYLFKARDLTATRVLVWIVISFILSHSLKVVLNTIEIYATLTMNKKGLLSIFFPFIFIC